MAALIENEEAAQRLALAIASDLFEYNKEKVAKAIAEDNFFEAMSESLEADRALFKARVAPQLYAKGLYERAVVDRVIRFQAHVKSKMW